MQANGGVPKSLQLLVGHSIVTIRDVAFRARAFTNDGP
jgi:hypothetical protein